MFAVQIQCRLFVLRFAPVIFRHYIGLIVNLTIKIGKIIDIEK